jgi:peptidoglycan hydrolase-like protein with peptidoglycan-binding domain
MNMSRSCSVLVSSLAVVGTAAAASADPLILQVEQSLSALGYDTGPVDGTESLETTIAISKFQAENGLAVTGEATPELAGKIAVKAAGGSPARGAAPAVATTAPVAADPEKLKAAQQACLQEKVAAKQDAQKKKRGLASLASAMNRVAGRLGIGDISRATQDVYSANATAEDLSSAAKDLGLTTDEVEACRNP